MRALEQSTSDGESMEQMISETGVILKDSQPQQLKLLVVGDTLPGGRAELSFSEPSENPLLERIQPKLLDCDLLLFNLEAPLCKSGKPIFKCGSNFQISPEAALGLKTAGFNVATLANNHIMDFGPEGLHETIQTLDNVGIVHLGAGDSLEESLRPLELEINGVKIAFLNWAEGEFSKSGPDGCGAAPMDDVLNKEAIQSARSASDIVVVSVHAGNEYQHFPSPWLQDTYRNYISWGATVVIGGHPHIPQGLEWHEEGLIVYSMGDFFFEYQNDVGTCVTHLLELGFNNKGIVAASLHPMRKEPDASMAPLDGDDKKIFINHLNDLCKPLGSRKMLSALWEQGVIRRSETFYVEKFKRNVALAFSEKNGNSFAAGFLFNMFDCPSHVEALKSTFSMIYSGNYKKDRKIQDFLDTLNKTLEYLSHKEMPEFGSESRGFFTKAYSKLRQLL